MPIRPICAGNCRCRVNTPTCATPVLKPNGSQPAYLGEQLSTQSTIVDIVARQGKAGLGIYISQEEHVLNFKQEIVLRRRHTLAVFPDKKFAAEKKDAS